MVTWRRRLLRLLTNLGLQVTDVRDGAVLLSRRPGLTTTTLGFDTWLLTENGGAKAVSLTDDVSLVGNVRDLQVVPAGGADRLVRPGQPRRYSWHPNPQLRNYLSAEHVGCVLRTYRVNCVLDVGAHVGEYAKSLRQVGYTGRIASFEPVPHFAETLEAAAADDPEWQVYPFALGREDTTVSMNVVPAGTASSMLPLSEFGRSHFTRLRDTWREKTTVRRLDGVLDDVLAGLEDPRPYLKLDTQGYDLEAFDGAGDRIRDFVGMQSEVALLRVYEGMPRMLEAVAAYEAAGFEITAMFPVSRERRTGRVLEFDCVMVRADALPT